MVRYFCRVAYDGAGFCGWQRQSDAISVQQVLEEAAARILRTPCKFTGAGRTDAGVHAKAMGAHFDIDGPIDSGKFALSMNSVLPREVAVYNVQQVNPSFHARFSARYRSYRYYLCVRKSPLLLRRAWHCSYPVDWGKLMVELPGLLGKHDFSTFCASGSGSATAICTVHAATIEKEDECMVFSIRADRFVYTMVRSIVGTLIDIGRGRQQLRLTEIIERKDRSLAGMTAPAGGLVLENVVYSEVE
jgi:tRNA pseudouridine38-40 synthase